MCVRGRYTGMLQTFSLLKFPVLIFAELVERSSLALGPRSDTISLERPGTVTVMTWEPVWLSQMSTVAAAPLGDVAVYLLSSPKQRKPSGLGQSGSDGVM